MVNLLQRLKEMQEEERRERPRTRVNFEGLEEEYDLRVTEMFPAYVNLEMVVDPKRKFTISKNRAMFNFCDREVLNHIAEDSIITVERSQRPDFPGIPVARIVRVATKGVIRTNREPLA